MLVVRSLVFIGALAVLAFGQTVAGAAGRAARPAQSKQVNYIQVEAADLLLRPAEYRGRRVTLTAQIVAVNARREALDLFDQHSRTLVSVSLAELPKAQRQQLLTEAIHHVTVYGLADLQNGRLVLKAEQVMPVEFTLAAR